MKFSNLCSILFIVVLSSCSQKEPVNTGINDGCSVKSDSQKVQIYSADSSMYPFLEKLIIKEQKCDYYNPITSGFFVFQWTGNLVIESCFINDVNWGGKGICLYNHHIFIINQPLKSVCYFRNTGKSFTIHYYNKQCPELDDILLFDDRGSSWTFICVDDQIDIVEKCPCYR